MHRVAAIGTFDGVHRGHRSVLKTLVEYAEANGMEPVAITFSSHPLALIAPERCPDELTPLSKKKKLLKELGVAPIVLDFDRSLRSTTASDWIKQIHDKYDVRALVLGYDNTFGSDGVNLSLDDFRKLGEMHGVEILGADEVKDVSSSAIRKAVKAGDMEKARQMLGRPYSITAKVVDGNRLGHTIGFPTANIEPTPGVALPKPGVYAAIVKILSDGSKHPAMVNIGTRPTVMRGDDTVIETNILGWNGDLYGKEITVRFIKRLRDEEKFDSIDALRTQLNKDKGMAIDIVRTEAADLL